MAVSDKKAKNKKIVLYDGLCTMCKGVADTIGNSSRGSVFATTDITNAKLPNHLTKEAVQREIHVIDNGKVYKNIDAIFKILEEYPSLAPVVRVGGVPGIRQFLRLVYRFVAAHRHIMFGPMARMFWLKVVVICSLLVGVLLSLPLWLSGRNYPLIPVMRTFPTIGHPYDLYILIILMVSLVGVLIRSQPRIIALCCVTIFGLLVLFDQSRLQPWVLQYVAMLAVVGLFSWVSNSYGIQRALNTERLIVVGTYFYSGLHKVNANFILHTFPWMLEPVTHYFSSETGIILARSIAVAIPFLEIGIACGLLSKKFRKQAIVVAIMMHLCILGLVGPLGSDWNSVIWPWNVAMILFDIILFWGDKTTQVYSILWSRKPSYQTAILVFFCILPALSFIGKWDSYLSSALYSGDIATAGIVIPDREVYKLPKGARPYVQKGATYLDSIDIMQWSFGELNVPAYPEPRIYMAIGRTVCGLIPDSLLIVVSRPSISGKSTNSVYTCSMLR